MAYRFVEPKRHPQEELAYIVYQAVAEEFHACICKSKAVEERLFLYCAEMNQKIRERKAELVKRKIHASCSKVSPVLGEMQAVSFIRKAADAYIFDFITGFEHIHVTVNADCTVIFTLCHPQDREEYVADKSVEKQSML